MIIKLVGFLVAEFQNRRFFGTIIVNLIVAMTGQQVLF